MSVTILHGDCVDTMRGMDQDSVDAIVTDPPYELGFMGKKWDASGIAYSVGMWSEALRVLKPGGHLLAFGGTRTYHRMACAIEDAGFDIRDCLQWLYGSGFPKSMNVGKAIDATLLTGGSHMKDLKRVNDEYRTGEGRERTSTNNNGIMGDSRGGRVIRDDPATPEAEQWSGWGTALKPANEPIVLARKPLSEKTVAANVLTHGTGAINVDGCRVEAADQEALAKNWNRNQSEAAEHSVAMGSGLKAIDLRGYAPTQGRFPANVILSHSSACEPTRTDTGEVSVACADDCPIRMLDTQSGVSKSQGGSKSSYSIGGNGKYSGGKGLDNIHHFGDTGGASRFFYVAKASKRERGAGNTHPTVKPVELMRYLIRMITPPGGVVLDPFAGSGTTGVAAIREGVYCILIEREAEYLPIIEARVAHG